MAGNAEKEEEEEEEEEHVQDMVRKKTKMQSCSFQTFNNIKNSFPVPNNTRNQHFSLLSLCYSTIVSKFINFFLNLSNALINTLSLKNCKC